MKNIMPFFIIGGITFLALFGSFWQVNSFAATLPVSPTGLEIKERAFQVEIVEEDQVVVSEGRDTEIDFPGYVHVAIPEGALPVGTFVIVDKLNPSSIPEGNTISGVRNPVQVSFSGIKPAQKGLMTFDLTPQAIEAYKTNTKMGILYFDPSKNEWELLAGVLSSNGQLSIDMDKEGIYTLGLIK